MTGDAKLEQQAHFVLYTDVVDLLELLYSFHCCIKIDSFLEDVKAGPKWDTAVLYM